ncbi:hypothetical protein C6501_07695 [Candidatus Poribacteria bacterium]|nr:MAG: hypothetical protein C6501_07695 [Candidatus Poribacteria bacterium]
MKTQIDYIKAELYEAFEKKAEELKKGVDEPPPVRVYDFSELDLPENEEETEPEKHEGPQTVEALLNSFEEMLVYPEIDEKYPQSEWVQMLLNRGIVIEDFADYSGYLSARQNLVYFENNPIIWQSGETGNLPTEDWETFKASFIDRHIWQYQQLKAAAAVDPEVTGGFFVGPDHKTFLPFKPGRVYVSRFERGAFFHGQSLTEKQKFDLLFKGIHPEGYDIIYLDGDDAILSEAPPLITREEIGGKREKIQVEQNSSTPFPSMEGFPADGNFAPHDDFAETFSEPTQPTAAAQMARAQEEKRRMEFLEKLTKNDAELERLLTSESQGLPTDKHIETAFPKQFEKALATLQRYGFKEGLQRIKKTDREVAAHLERIFLSQQHPTHAKQDTSR